MKVKDLIQELQHFNGDDEVVLFDRSDERELRVDPDAGTFEFEITRGDHEVVFEFD